MKIEIAGLFINIIDDIPEINSKLNHFSSNFQKKSDLHISIIGKDSITPPEGQLIINDKIKYIRRYDGGIAAYIFLEEQNQILCKLEVNNNWSIAVIEYLEGLAGDKYFGAIFLLEVLFRNSILHHKGFVIHSSAIKYENKGILFTAPSGTGKSTQANLWGGAMKSIILNDDRPAVRIIDNIPYVFGTPFSGSSNLYVNDASEISAIVVVEQSKFNHIKKLSLPEALTRVLPRVFLPYYDGDMMSIAVNNLGQVLQSIPVYLLQCKPDKEAVELLYQCVR